MFWNSNRPETPSTPIVVELTARKRRNGTCFVQDAFKEWGLSDTQMVALRAAVQAFIWTSNTAVGADYVAEAVAAVKRFEETGVTVELPDGADLEATAVATVEQRLGGPLEGVKVDVGRCSFEIIDDGPNVPYMHVEHHAGYSANVTVTGWSSKFGLAVSHMTLCEGLAVVVDIVEDEEATVTAPLDLVLFASDDLIVKVTALVLPKFAANVTTKTLDENVSLALYAPADLQVTELGLETATVRVALKGEGPNATTNYAVTVAAALAAQHARCMMTLPAEA